MKARRIVGAALAASRSRPPPRPRRLADPAADRGGAVRGRRPDRRGRPHPLAADDGAARPAGRRRQHPGRRRHGGREPRRQGGVRRLHGPARQPGHPHVQPVPLQEAAVQSGDRVHARRAPGQQHQGPGRAQGPARQHACRIHRLCAGQPGQDAIRLGRRRLGHPHRLRAAQRQDGHQHHPRALSRHRPRPAGPDGRAHRLHVRGDLDRPAADPRRHHQGDRHHVGHPRRRAARRADHARAGPRRRRRQRLDGFFFPKDTPDAIVRRVNAATAETLDTPAVRKRIEDLGLFVAPPAERSPEFLARLVVSELEKWGPPIRAAGVSAD